MPAEETPYELARKGLDFASIRAEGGARSEMAKYIHTLAAFQILDPKNTAYDGVEFFFSLLKGQCGEFGPRTGFWNNRNWILRNLENVWILWVDLDYVRDFYRKGDPFIESIISLEENKKYILNGCYLFLGWLMVRKGESPDDDHYIEYFDTFIRGLNIGKEMWKHYAYVNGIHTVSVVPYGVIERSNAYFASFDCFRRFEDEAEVFDYVNHLGYANSLGFAEEWRKHQNFEDELEPPAKQARVK